MEVKAFGKVIGHADDRALLNEDVVVFYDFQPNWDLLEDFRGADLYIDWAEGILTARSWEDDTRAIATYKALWR